MGLKLDISSTKANGGNVFLNLQGPKKDDSKQIIQEKPPAVDDKEKPSMNLYGGGTQSQSDNDPVKKPAPSIIKLSTIINEEKKQEEQN